MSLTNIQLDQISFRLEQLAERKARLVEELDAVEAESQRLHDALEEHQREVGPQIIKDITNDFLETVASSVDLSEADVLDSLIARAWGSIRFARAYSSCGKFGPNLEKLAIQELAQKMHEVLFPGEEVDDKPGGVLWDIVEEIVGWPERGDRLQAEKVPTKDDENEDGSDVERDDDEVSENGTTMAVLNWDEAVNNPDPKLGKRKEIWAQDREGGRQNKKRRPNSQKAER